ncbi:MAG: zinc-dependent peptidase [Crocinitomicaceae bacterium]|nr:zinc-dependent peptidase [Crocinitomicaceae bacterium]
MNNFVIYIFIGAAIAVLVGYSRLKTKNQTYKREPKRDFPKEWRRLLREHIEFYNKLNNAKKTEFEKRVHVFLLNVQIVGVDTGSATLDWTVS